MDRGGMMARDTVREILERFADTIDCQGSADGDYDQAITSLAQAIRERKLGANGRYNDAIEDIARWVEEK
jgi:hypothetical protein